MPKTNAKLQKSSQIYANVELIASAAAMMGLVVMQMQDPGFYVQLGICAWLCAQIILVVWWHKRVSSPFAITCMGLFNIFGSVFFLISCLESNSAVGVFVSSSYIASSSLQFFSGLVRLQITKETNFSKRLEQIISKRLTLLSIATLQAFGAMGFITLSPLAGICYTSAAFLSITNNLLTLQRELLLKEMDAPVMQETENPTSNVIPFSMRPAHTGRNLYSATK